MEVGVKLLHLVSDNSLVKVVHRFVLFLPQLTENFVFLFVCLILYVPSTSFQLNRDGSS